jgi:hypothetical protein
MGIVIVYAVDIEKGASPEGMLELHRYY